MTEQFESVLLDNGLCIRFFDQTNRYYGDFHRVCIKVVISLPDRMLLPSGMNKERACLERRLEKMGVPGESVADERKALIESFLATSQAYLERDSFPQQLLLKLQQEKSKPIFLRER